ncbi:unnamed protein product [Rotaria sp. Silwood1]|nr:unnamed protein product [Rotaria sp. Silwood1]CAF1532590.1 unnamed protein product [Rotaria sp. Silwood1]CAF3665484.1 unnamed protein product [Rotaria sp. Silwood1]CAF3695789.1 unnamed protein product [Rotaria sp. Silwood1]
MDKNPSKTSAASAATTEKATTTTTLHNTGVSLHNTRVSLHNVRRVLQNFLLIWLDANIDESQEDFKNSLAHLRHIVASITTFTNVQECTDFLREIESEKAFMIVSGSLGQHIVPKIYTWPQLHSIYVFCNNRSVHEQWAKNILKIKGVHTNIESICKALQNDSARCDRALISISFRGIDASFMYTQLIKEALLEINDDEDGDNKSIREFAEYCRLQNDIATDEIESVEREYHQHTPIWWYTAPFFIYSMLNRGLRLLDVDIILKMGFFIRHLHRHIEKLHREQQSKVKTAKVLTVYRGQGLSLQDFEKVKQTKGGLMSFNNFLSTSRDRDLSLNAFARPAALQDSDSVGILFVMIIDPKLCATSSTPYVDVNNLSFFSDEGSEILFSTHTIFRIDQIKHIDDHDTERLWQVNLTFTGNDDHDLNALTAHMRKELSWTKGWSRLGDILIKMGHSAKAEQLYQILVDNAHKANDRANYNYQLGLVYSNMGEYSKALASHQQALDIRKKTLPPNHPDLATSYNTIGLVYSNMGEYSKALASHQQALDIRKKTLPPNHLDLATSYNTIGLVYSNRGEYSKALSFYEQALDIRQKILPPTHPDIATSYNNIGLIYSNMGEYTKALSFYEQALHIRQNILPPNHPDLATSYNTVGLVHSNMGDYAKALSFYEQALDICQKMLPPNHPDFAQSYNNIGWVYSNMSEYSKALSCYERALDIRQKILPPNHPDLATSYSNIGKVYSEMGKYSKALASHQRALDIYQKTLPPEHPNFAQSYNNMAMAYQNMGEYVKALPFLEQAINICQKSLPPNHPNFAQSYKNMGMVYQNMGNYKKALSFFERALDINEKSLPPSHPHIALVRNSIECVKKKM